MNTLGLLNIGSALYLSWVISLSVTMNENRGLGVIVRKSLELWLKFLGFLLVLVAIVQALSCIPS